MTKLTNQKLPRKRNSEGRIPMYYCKICKEYVPDEIKHNKKRHLK